MRHALTAEPTARISMPLSRPDAVRRFRPANAGLALVHAAQAVLILAIAGDDVLPVTHGSATLFEVSIGAVMAVFFAATAVNHGLCATVLRATYEADLREGRNRIRWVEFAISAPMLMLVIALYTGVTDVAALVVVAAATLVMVMCGWIQEAANPPGRRTTTMAPFWAGVVAASVPWSLVAGQMIETSGTREFSLSIFLSLFLLWTSFGVNQWLQYREVGPWADYLYGERTYLVLSLVAKSALAWQIVAGSRLL